MEGRRGIGLGMMTFEIMEHTADVGIIAYGQTLGELLANAAAGMFSIIAEMGEVLPKESAPLELTAGGVEELVHGWLSELNYRSIVREELYVSYSFSECSPTRVKAMVHGEKIDFERHMIYTEVKAVTWHELKVEHLPSGWRAQVIFDL